MAEEGQAVWNADQEQLKYLFVIKGEIISYFRERDIENLYWNLRILRNEIDAKLNDTEQVKLKEQLDEIDGLRDQLVNDKNNLNIVNNLFFKMEEFYIQMCRLMKEHALYFREYEEDDGL